MIRDTATLIEKCRALLAHVRDRHGEITYHEASKIGALELPPFYDPSGVMVESRYIADLGLCVEFAEAPIDAADVLIAFKAERLACHRFVSGEPEGQDARLLAWDEARERYAQLLAEYCRQTGLTTRKAEKGLGALWIESMGAVAP